jgi:hypothetical protein
VSCTAGWRSPAPRSADIVLHEGPGAVERALTTGPDAMIRRVRTVVMLYMLVLVGGLALYIVVGLTHG